MLYPDELIALAELRYEAIQDEARRQSLLAQSSQPAARWRLWTGSSLMWAGSRLVQWGEGLTVSDCAASREILN